MSNTIKLQKNGVVKMFQNQQQVADYLGVTKQAVAKAIKKKEMCKGAELIVMYKNNGYTDKTKSLIIDGKFIGFYESVERKGGNVFISGFKEELKGASNMNELINQVEQWSKDKGLDKAESSKQMLKVVEEVGEVASALARGNQDMLRDGIGDVVVTLIILAQQNEMDLYECLNTAYDEIKGRQGKMVDGVFVKASDLNG